MRRPIKTANGRVQSAMELLIVYGIALLIIAVAITLLYSISVNASNSLNSACTFSGGVACSDLIFGTNTLTGNAMVIVVLDNVQSNYIESPSLLVRVSSVNSTSYACTPSYVKAGGSMVCVVGLPSKFGAGQGVTGNLYLSEQNCAFATNQANCKSQASQVYAGSFGATSQTVPQKLNFKIMLSAAANPAMANNQKDQLVATLTLQGNPLKGATINFTANTLGFSISPAYANTNTAGQAVSYIWGSQPGTMKVYANFSNTISANIILTFNSVGGQAQGNELGLLSQSCSIPPVNTITVTDANWATYNPLSAISAGTYEIEKVTSNSLTVNGNTHDCFAIDTTVGGGTLALDMGGSSENNMVEMAGNADVPLTVGGSSNFFTLNDEGNGEITGTLGGSSSQSSISSGTGNVILAISGSSGTVSSLTSASENMIVTVTGSSQTVNLVSTASNANVAVSITPSPSSDTVNLQAGTGTAIAVPSIVGSSNVFNSIGGTTVTITSLTGSSNLLYLWGENVYVGSCEGSSNKIYLEGGSTYLASSPYQAVSGASC